MWPQMNLEVLNVGDGACSVITEGGGERLILDCGSWRSGGKPEAHLLAQSLGRGLRNVTTLVVSHFDADHWKGLAALPSVAARDNLPDKVQIRYPGLPQVAKETTLAYLALRSLDEGISLRAQDLIAAWNCVAEVDAKPLFAGSRIVLGSVMFDVVWPPRDLPQSWSSAAQRTLDLLHALASRVPALQRALDDAYSDAWPGAGQAEALEDGWGYDGEDGHLASPNEDLDDTYETLRRQEMEAEVARDLARQGVFGTEELPGRPDRWRQPSEAEGNRLDARAVPEGWRDQQDRGPADGAAPGARSGPGPTGHTELFGADKAAMPYQEQLRELARRLGVLNNHLSLVMVSREAGFIGLGDAQDWSLRRVGEELHKIQGHYAVALAPHHGTVSMPDNFPTVGTCVLQNGASHLTRAYRHVHSHQCFDPVATEVSGNLHLQLPRFIWGP